MSIKLGTRVRMLEDAPPFNGEFSYRKDDIGIVTKAGRKYLLVNFNGVEGQHVHDDGKWLVPRSDCEVIE